MLKSIIPKLPMQNLQNTKRFYCYELGFRIIYEFDDYLIVKKDDVEIHFFLFEGISKSTNYGMCYIRVSDIEAFYNDVKSREAEIAKLGQLELKPWNQMEFSIVDNSGNLITFGEPVSREVLEE